MCDAGEPVPCTVLDPFLGSGTTALVALCLGRTAIGVELNPEYAEMARWPDIPEPTRAAILTLAKAAVAGKASVDVDGD